MNENNQLNRVRAALYDSWDYQDGCFYVCGENSRWYEVKTWEYLDVIATWEYVEVAYDLR